MLTFFLVMHISQSALSILKVYSALKKSKKGGGAVEIQSAVKNADSRLSGLQNGGEIQSSGSV